MTMLRLALKYSAFNNKFFKLAKNSNYDQKISKINCDK